MSTYNLTDQSVLEDELRLAREQAEQANRAKIRFLTAASHEMRQPLHAINMYLGILGTETGEAERSRVINQARISLDTISSLLNSVQDISKLESGAVRPFIQEFPIHDVLRRVYNSGVPLAMRKQLRYSYVPCGSIVSSDGALLEQLLCNLVSNAQRYTPNGGHVLLGCRRRGETLEIQVLDNGIGIPEHNIKNIFNEYVLLGQNKRSSQGMGLGLAIVKHIADLLGLQYEVRSEEDLGTVFSVHVPLVQGRGVKPVKIETSQQKTEEVNKAKTVLMVEDDHIVLQSTSMFFEVSGLNVLPTRDLVQALQLAAKIRPDLIISDYALGNRENGIQVVAALRNLLGENVKAVILTGDTSAELAREAVESNCEIIYKPIKPDTLLESIHSLVKDTYGTNVHH